MDAYKEARTSFESSPRSSDHFLFDVATEWAKQVSSLLNKSIAIYGSDPVLGDKNKQNVVTGLFFGVTPTGELAFYYQDVSRVGDGVDSDKKTGTVILQDDMIYIKSGVFGETVDEIQAGKTKRAQLEAHPWVIFPVVNWAVWKAVRLAQITLADHPDKAGNPTSRTGYRGYDDGRAYEGHAARYCRSRKNVA